MRLEGEQPPAEQPHGSTNTTTTTTTTRLMVGSRQLRGTLQPVFQDPANQQHGLWACKKCAAQRAPPPHQGEGSTTESAEAAAAAALLHLTTQPELPCEPAPPTQCDVLTRADAAQQQHLSSIHEKEELTSLWDFYSEVCDSLLCVCVCVCVCVHVCTCVWPGTRGKRSGRGVRSVAERACLHAPGWG